jgi:hypothetical protein
MKTCNECETKIESFSDNSEHRLFVNHLRKVHNMSQEEYDIKYKYKNELSSEFSPVSNSSICQEFSQMVK